MVIWVTGVGVWTKEFKIFETRICKLYDTNGPKFTFQYLKEVSRLTIKYLSGEWFETTLGGMAGFIQPSLGLTRFIPKEVIPLTETFDNPLFRRELKGQVPKGTTLVRLSGGIPAIIPYKLREVLRKRSFMENRDLIIAILSLISMYRVFPTKVKPNLESITAPFTGDSRVLDINRIKSSLSELYMGGGLLFKVRLIGGESAGPISSKAVWASDTDAFAFLHNPKQFWSMINLLVYYGAWGYLIWFLVLSVVLSPYYLITLILGRLPILLGRLSVVYDQAGKARIVAITNWWIQFGLRPLHDAIFSILKTVPMDGTFNQEAPLHRLMERCSGQKFYSFDLSSATDRLPIDLQGQVLSVLVSDTFARIWVKLLDFGWSWGYTQRVHYSVGQPMGAYSSWAMLALTHHVIVKYAAQKVGIRHFSDYALLGDDIVIANDKVAMEYLNLMKILGVSINLSKSVRSYDFAEFAKKWVGPKCDISPVGAGVLLQASRSRYYISRLLLDLMARKIPRSTNGMSLLKFYVSTAPYYVRKGIHKVYWTLLLNGLTEVSTPNKSLGWILDEFIGLDWSFNKRGEERGPWTVESVWALAEQRFANDKNRLKSAVKYLLYNAVRTTQTKGQFFYPADLLFVFIKPGFWYYLIGILSSLSDLTDRHIWLSAHRKALYKYRLSRQRYPFTLEYLLSMTDIINVKSIDWLDEVRIRDQNSLVSQLSSKYDLRKTLYCDPTFRNSIVLPLRLATEQDQVPILSPASNWPRYLGDW